MRTKLMNLKLFIFVLIGVILISIGTYFFTTYGPNLLALEKGDIIPFNIDTNKDFEVQMGGVHVATTIKELSIGLNMTHYFNINNIKYPFQISFNYGKLLVSAEIKDDEGNTAAKISNNKWVVNPNPIVTYDKNYNSYALEVITPNQIPILQVVMTPENKIFVGGVFNSNNTTMISMLNDTTIFGETGSTKITNAIAKYDQTIFRYPSGSHLGELTANSPYAFSINLTFPPETIINVGYVLFAIGTLVIAYSGLRETRKHFSPSSDFYKSDEQKGFSAGNKLGKDECDLTVKRWVKLKKRVLPILDKPISDRTSLENKLVNDYELFWMREAISHNKNLKINSNFSDGYKKAILKNFITD
jgi:hypothetical protein